ncbi:(2,3-dihydroxybenzoyl)adenylate synthase [Luedemannella helvata]|uniref:(2,3-dihydroxybenzoyl)adenylate synthase n=1 Tax=Luedemannella helvata TaxID=349315 RepID=A0ABN2KXS5_9ACTN
MLTGAVPWPAEFAERYRRAGYWTGETLADLLREPARTAGDRPAVVTLRQRVSYAELDAWADELCGGLWRLGLRAGDRVVVQLPNGPDFLALLVALFRLGAVPVLALPAHRLAEIGYLCAHTGATALVIPDVLARFDHRELAREVSATVPELRHVLVAGAPGEFTALAQVRAEPVDLPGPDPDEVALLLLSGGTTGRPKLIPRTHNDYAYQLRTTAAEMGFDASGAYLAALPAAHNAALGCPGVLGALRVGAPAVLAASPSPDEVFPLIAREGVTLTTLMPAFLPLWMETAPIFQADLSKLTVEVGGAALDPRLAARAEEALGCTLTRWFGMAEGLLSFTRPDEPAQFRHTTEGRPMSADDELRAVGEDGRDVPAGEVGELLVRGPYTLRGYYRAEEHNRTAFTSDGFYRTGDLVRLLPDGAMVVEGRIKDVVNRGGEKVSAVEVEEHLRAHPKVADVAVVAVPDPGLGERSCAFVVATDGEPALSELRGFLTERGLAGYKLPDALILVEDFPYTPVGKVDKAALRASHE